MRRSLLLLLGICAITYLEFSFYPGHTFLEGETQPLVAMMERLQSPGFLSRDLAAINPNLTYTIYDEVTLFLCRVTTHNFQWALAAQQIAFRFAGVLGVLLLCLAADIRRLAAVAVTALASAGIVLPGIHLSLTDPEPVPFAFALALSVAAFGLLANHKPLLAGLLGGVALAYQPSIASIFWLFVVGTFVFRREFRPVLRPTFPSLIVFGLLLANAAQLQSGRGESQPLFQAIPDAWMRLQLYRTPELWVSTWNPWLFLFYSFVVVASGFALRQLWPALGPLPRHLFTFLLGLGLLAVPGAFVGVQVFRSAILSEAQLPRVLAFLFLTALILCASVGLKHWNRNQKLKASLWLIPVFMTPFLLRVPWPSNKQRAESQSIRSIADWAASNTWGGSMFLFPDLGKSAIPGKFRGISMRALYSDWESGRLVGVFPQLGAEWYQRWIETGAPTYSVMNLQKLLNLPVEYVVLQHQHCLAGVKPEVTTPDFVVYDAHVLQTAPHPLRNLY